MALIKKGEVIYSVKVYKRGYFQGSVVVAEFGEHERTMSGTHALSADLVALERVVRAAATYFGLQANMDTIGELVQRRLDVLMDEEQDRARCTDEQTDDAGALR